VRSGPGNDVPLWPTDRPYLQDPQCARGQHRGQRHREQQRRDRRQKKTDWPKGYSCIAEKRAIETIQSGKPITDYMKFGDTIKIEMKGKDGQSIFGAIDQKVVSLM
jgi:hypothetical protein